MARLADLIRDGAAPASMMRRAAQGELSLPAAEAIELLVALVGNRELGEEAERTLGNWDEQSLIEVASNALTAKDVLVHLLPLFTDRPSVVAALSENPALPLAELEATASHAGVEVLRAMMQSARVRGSSLLLEQMAGNTAAEPIRPEVHRWRAIAQRNEIEELSAKFLIRHAEEVEKESTQAFELVSGPEGEDDPLNTLLAREKRGEAASKPEEIEQLSLLQRLGRMRVGERIKVAMRGNREERMVLIRDRSKLVSLAVLESPKVTDGEMVSFAAMKNVQEGVLRAISTKRNYIKNYEVLCALVGNPKTPLDIALPLVAHLLVKDQRGLSVNKNINETVRKMALKLYRMKSQRKAES